VFLYKFLPVSSSVCFAGTVNMYIDMPGYAFPSYQYEYYFSDSSQFIYKGYCYHDPFYGGEKTFSDPPVHMIAPFYYQDSYTDSLEGILDGGGGTTVWQTQGYVSKQYDGYGELRLPGGIYPNVARVRIALYEKDTLTISQNVPGEVRIFSTTGFEWYDLNFHGPIFYYMEYVTITIPVNGATVVTNVKQVFSLLNSIVGIADSRSEEGLFKIFPNPGDGMVEIKIPDDFKNEKNLTLCVFENTGKLIQQKKLQMNDGKIKLNLEAEAKGIYNVSLSNGKKSYSGKIVFE
ncbi:MAG TPA: T9SS type A sorting domain-containing protein, partial [Bacteroidia bacterium]|nr:T9SS type A sorting domain-containing protein [Bacteroidia bacterium]